MSYDGRLMRQALARFDEDKQRRAENFRARERAVYTKCPRIEEIDRELSHTMAKIIASGLRRGTDPRPAIEALREENLNLQQEKRLLLTRLGLPGDYLEEKPKCSRCNDTGFLGSEVCSCLRGYYAKEQNKELSGLFGPRLAVLRKFQLRLLFVRAGRGPRRVAAHEHGARVRHLPGLRARVFAQERQPAADRRHGTGENVPLRVHRARRERERPQRGLRHGGAHLRPLRGAEVRPRRRRERRHRREPRARLRPADFRRPRHRTDDELCPQRDVSDRQHAPHHGEEDRHLHEPEPRRARAALRRAGAVKIAGRVSNAALFSAKTSADRRENEYKM